MAQTKFIADDVAHGFVTKKVPPPPPPQFQPCKYFRCACLFNRPCGVCKIIIVLRCLLSYKLCHVLTLHSGPGRAQNWTKTKISIYQKNIFVWAKSKDDILDIMCLNLFELKIIISTLKITSKSNL